jgi:hypothetical protein
MFAPLWLPVVGVFLVLVVPGLLMGAGLGALYQLRPLRRLITSFVSAGTEVGLLWTGGLLAPDWKVIAYSALASALLATAPIRLVGLWPSARDVLLAGALGAAVASFPFLVPVDVNLFGGAFWLGLAGCIWLWSQYFFHSRILIRGGRD